MRIITGPTVQLGLDLPYPSLRPKQRKLRFVGVHRRPSRHSSLLPADLLVPFAMCTPLACSDYYGTSAPSTTLSRQRTCPPTDRMPDGRAAADGSHVHHESIDEVGARLNPDNIATPTPQFFDVASPPDQ